MGKKSKGTWMGKPHEYAPEVVVDEPNEALVDAHAEIRADLAESYERYTASMSEPAAIAPGDPAAIGWVVWPSPDGRGGLVRRKVRLPMSVVEAHAVGPATSPDLRSSVAEKIAVEIRRDAFIAELGRAGRGER